MTITTPSLLHLHPPNTQTISGPWHSSEETQALSHLFVKQGPITVNQTDILICSPCQNQPQIGKRELDRDREKARRRVRKRGGKLAVDDAVLVLLAAASLQSKRPNKKLRRKKINK